MSTSMSVSVSVARTRFPCLAKQVVNERVGIGDRGAGLVELSQPHLLLLKVQLLLRFGFGGATCAASGST